MAMVCPWRIAMLAALLAPPWHAQAQQPDTIAALGSYAETYLRTPSVSGSLLVGLRWAGRDKGFEPGNVHIPVPAPKPGTVCVAILSKDGRYAAENLYDLASSKTASPRLQVQTSYGQQLRTYTSDDMAVLVRRAQSCNEVGDTAILPASLNAEANPGTSGARAELLAFINADPNRVGLTLAAGEAQIAIGTCGPVGEGVHIAYSAQCVLSVPPRLPATDLQLRLTVKERFKTVPTTYKLLLP